MMPLIDVLAIIWADIVWKWVSGFAFAMLRYAGFKEASHVGDNPQSA